MASRRKEVNEIAEVVEGGRGREWGCAEREGGRGEVVAEEAVTTRVCFKMRKEMKLENKIFLSFCTYESIIPRLPLQEYEIGKNEEKKAANGKEVLQYSGDGVEVMAGLNADLDRFIGSFCSRIDMETETETKSCQHHEWEAQFGGHKNIAVCAVLGSFHFILVAPAQQMANCKAQLDS
ncbi:hypothetical protein SADUNF_Sadunf15G0067800 [Salix dunnii]|uniref:Uncharacterized protein n=1 Tax=Salix dunnii TaxID=1413687 RepID=A0A835MNU2_9ROSI|nr:hypothetical protein SADUNF_Sadunf15G0067800 [Salix dunnii]